MKIIYDGKRKAIQPEAKFNYLKSKSYLEKNN